MNFYDVIRNLMANKLEWMMLLELWFDAYPLILVDILWSNLENSKRDVLIETCSCVHNLA